MNAKPTALDAYLARAAVGKRPLVPQGTQIVHTPEGSQKT